MEFHGIEKLRGAENWHIWKFAVKNLLRGIEGAYEVCIGELLERELAEQGESPEQGRLLWVGSASPNTLLTKIFLIDDFCFFFSIKIFLCLYTFILYLH
jgi:hypothetical protein